MKVEDENSEQGGKLRDDQKAESKSRPNIRHAKNALATGEGGYVKSTSELRETWVKQRCLTLKSKMLINGKLFFVESTNRTNDQDQISRKGTPRYQRIARWPERFHMSQCAKCINTADN